MLKLALSKGRRESDAQYPEQSIRRINAPPYLSNPETGAAISY
jgi:hypothetical protein